MQANSDALGEIRQTFRPKAANLCAGAILGLGLVLGGASAAIFLGLRDDPKPLDTGDRYAKYAMLGVLGIGAPLGGIVLLVWIKRLASHRVTVFDNGFSYVYGGTTDIVPWNEVDKIREIFTHEQLKVLKVPGAAIKNIDRSFVVHRSDGKVFRFTVNSINSIRRLAECLEEARVKHGIGWERIEL